MGQSGDRAPWRSAAAQVLVSDLSEPELEDGALHHLSRVLRLRVGAEVCANDGAGRWVRCEFTGTASLRVVGETFNEPRPEPSLTVGFALVKGAKPELVVQKLTEVGIDRIVAFPARRSVVRWNAEKAGRQLRRLRRVAAEACSQCRRLHLPEVSYAPDGVAGPAALAQPGGRALRRSDLAVLIGPEGGWDDDEARVADHVSLGPNILRSETAAIVAAAQMVGLRSGMLDESP